MREYATMGTPAFNERGKVSGGAGLVEAHGGETLHDSLVHGHPRRRR